MLIFNEKVIIIEAAAMDALRFPRLSDGDMKLAVYIIKSFYFMFWCQLRFFSLPF